MIYILYACGRYDNKIFARRLIPTNSTNILFMIYSVLTHAFLFFWHPRGTPPQYAEINEREMMSRTPARNALSLVISENHGHSSA